jgi:hypothetical protein
MPKEIVIKGTPREQELFSEVNRHYSLSRQDLEQRIYRRNGFDDADKMFASHIDEAGWPYHSLIFDPIPYTVILEKSARLIGSKPKGRLVPREGGDSLGAYINNELLDYQWEDNTRLGQSMISKWIMMDQNTRKYGSSFALVKWRYECKNRKDGEKYKKDVFYDGPDFIVCNNRDVLANPSYEYINKWFQHREYLTIKDMQTVNDVSRGEPVYKNLEELKSTVMGEMEGRGDKRDIVSKNKSIRGLQDVLGSDVSNKVIEVVTEYRPDRWITFAPKHGVILRDIPNPYKHGEIPVVHLKYYPLPDDLYGVSELEPVSKQIKAINAHDSAYSDGMALALRPPTHINPINVRMHTIAWDPEAKWLMNSPNVDAQVMKMDQFNSISNNYTTIKTMLRSSLLNALGESSQGISTINPTQDQGRVTATEVKDTAFTRNVRDNMNKIFLSEALKKQIMFWHSMNQQFMFTAKADQLKIIRIVGRDAVEFFTRQGLSDIRPTEEDAMMVANGQINQNQINPGPRYAVNIGQDEEGMPLEVPKYMPDEGGNGGSLIIEPGDLSGNYDYVPDIESMAAPSNEEVEQKLASLLMTMTNPAILQGLASEGVKPKFKELLVRGIEATNMVKDAEAYFEDVSNAQGGTMGGGVLNDQNQIVQGGVGGPTGGIPSQGVVPTQGMAGSSVAPSQVGGSISGGGPAQI